jgi:hypothetical protein
MAVPKPSVDVGHRSPNAGGYGGTRKIEAFAVHITDGLNSLGWLTSPVSQASANYLVRRDGYIYELVPPAVSPWTNGDVQRPDLGNPLIAAWVKAGINPNTRCLTVEMEGKSTYWNPGALTDKQEDSLVALLAWGLDSNGLPVNDTRVIRHSQINDVTRHNCPGFAPAEWAAYIARAAQLVAQGGGTPAGGDDVKEPAPGTADQYLNSKGELLAVVNFGGQATTILGVNYADLGGSVRNSTGEEYDRSLKAGVMGPWTRRAP